MNYLLEISNGTWLSLRHRNGYQKLELKENIMENFLKIYTEIPKTTFKLMTPTTKNLDVKFSYSFIPL